ncbi:MAG: DsbA family oxidoreductase [Actinomycetota bacterium]|jgi:predicted DsbA family dithiol-disulfide isomerase|nr:DsbA family oxidoreductase [Actinomycetota bacterium]
MQVEIWSDVVCPWCYIGKRRFEAALDRFDGKEDVEIIWRSFELDPSAPRVIGEDMATRLSKKYQMSKDEAMESMASITVLARAEGLDYHLESAKQGNSFDAHRLIQLAALNGLGSQMKERLLKAYFTESLEIFDPEILAELGGEVGLDERDLREMYASDYLAESVRNDEAQASRYGINGVPFFVFDAKYGVSGAQPTEVFLDVLNRVDEEASSAYSDGGTSAASCSDDSCAI